MTKYYAVLKMNKGRDITTSSYSQQETILQVVKDYKASYNILEAHYFKVTIEEIRIDDRS
jgi:hypothetical protein